MCSRLLGDKIIGKISDGYNITVMRSQVCSPSFICRNIGRTSEWVGRMSWCWDCVRYPIVYNDVLFVSEKNEYVWWYAGERITEFFRSVGTV